MRGFLLQMTPGILLCGTGNLMSRVQVSNGTKERARKVANLVKSAEVVLEVSVRAEVLDVATILLHETLITLGSVLGTGKSGELWDNKSDDWKLALMRQVLTPHFFETMIFWRPGNLYWARRRACSVTIPCKHFPFQSQIHCPPSA